MITNIKRAAATTIVILAVLAAFQARELVAQAQQPAAPAAAAEAAGFRIVPVWFHVHSKFSGDDGSESTTNIAEWLKARGYMGVVLTPHSDGLSFPAFKAEAEAGNSHDFIVVTGREISTQNDKEFTDLVMCHLNAISDSDDPPALDRKYRSELLPGLIKELDAENAVYIWNHPWACKQWEQYSGMFKGIELFNDIGVDYQSGKNYNFNTGMYLSGLKRGEKQFVVSGIDMHTMLQATLGDFTTYIFPDEFNHDSLVSAIRNGYTVAAFNAKINSLNMRPSLAPVATAGNAFGIKGSVSLKMAGGPKPSIVIYKGGEKYMTQSPAILTRASKSSKGYSQFEFSFGDKLAPGESACYAFEIPHYMFSSPYCFEGGK
ncbi:MAG: hypothetical protein WCX65_06465 [bacterium]